MKKAKTTTPPVIGAFVFLGALFVFILGFTYICAGEEVLGVAIYIIAAVASVLILAG